MIDDKLRAKLVLLPPEELAILIETIAAALAVIELTNGGHMLMGIHKPPHLNLTLAEIMLDVRTKIAEQHEQQVKAQAEIVTAMQESQHVTKQ